jgi:uncharacterized membrane protein
MMVLPPIMAHLEQDLFAEVLYNANEPLCHQYIGRSFCVYNNWMVNDCDLNKTANVTTEFNYYLTNKYSVVASKFDGEYSYNRNLVGIHRAERIDYEGGIYAYKLGVCARDTAIFLGLLFAPLIYFLLKSKIKSTPHILIAFLFLVPMGLDGVGQLIGLWESTNLIRLMTGLIAGLGIGYFLYAILVDINKKKKEEK